VNDQTGLFTVKLTPPDQYPVAHPVAGQGVDGIGEQVTESANRKATVTGQCFEGQVGVKRDRDGDALHHLDPFQISRWLHGSATPLPGLGGSDVA